MDVALETASLLVLSSDQPLARSAQVLDEPNVPEDEARLGRQVLHKARLGGVDRIARRERNGDRPEQLALVPDGEAVLPSNGGSSSPGIGSGARAVASAGQAATGRRSSPTRNHTRATLAPVPSARSATIRGSTSSTEYASPTRPPNAVSTSYGVARAPYTIRSASRRANRRTGPNASATTRPATKATVVP